MHLLDKFVCNYYIDNLFPWPKCHWLENKATHFHMITQTIIVINRRIEA
jgi:hypothetical protein